MKKILTIIARVFLAIATACLIIAMGLSKIMPKKIHDGGEESE